MSLIKCTTWIDQVKKDRKFLGTESAREVELPDVTGPDYYNRTIMATNWEFPVVEVELPPEIAKPQSDGCIVSRMWFSCIGDKTRIFSAMDYFEYLAENTKAEPKTDSWSDTEWA